MGEDLHFPDLRVYIFLPELVVTVSAVTVGIQHSIVYSDNDYRLHFTVGCRTMDVAPIEK